MARRKLVKCGYSKCEITFVPERKTGKFCSPKHRVYANREKNPPKKEKVERIKEEPLKDERKGGICPHGTLRGYGVCPECRKEE